MEILIKTESANSTCESETLTHLRAWLKSMLYTGYSRGAICKKMQVCTKIINRLTADDAEKRACVCRAERAHRHASAHGTVREGVGGAGARGHTELVLFQISKLMATGSGFMCVYCSSMNAKVAV